MRSIVLTQRTVSRAVQDSDCLDTVRSCRNVRESRIFMRETVPQLIVCNFFLKFAAGVHEVRSGSAGCFLFFYVCCIHVSVNSRGPPPPPPPAKLISASRHKARRRGGGGGFLQYHVLGSLPAHGAYVGPPTVFPFDWGSCSSKI